MAATPTHVTANTSNAPDATVVPVPISPSRSTLNSSPIPSHSTPAEPTFVPPSIPGAHDFRPPPTPSKGTFDASIRAALNPAPAGSTSGQSSVSNTEHDSVPAPTHAPAAAPQGHPSPTHQYLPFATATQPTLFSIVILLLGSTVNHTRDQFNYEFFQYFDSKPTWSTRKKRAATKAATYLLIAVILTVIVGVGFGVGLGVGVGIYKRPSSAEGNVGPAGGLTNATQDSLSGSASSSFPEFTLGQSSASTSASITSITFTETIIINASPSVVAPTMTGSVSTSTITDKSASIWTFTFITTIGTATSSSLGTLGTPESPPI